MFSDGEKISLRIVPRPGMWGAVRGILKNKETGTPVKNEIIPLLKVKSANGCKLTFEFGTSGDGKMLGGMTTKTDDAGAFRFEDVEKGIPYMLGAIDNAGKNVLVILSTDDNAKDLGIVYQKKQSEKQKAGKEEERQAEVEREKPQKGATLAMGVRPSVSAANEIKRDGRFIAYDNGTILDTSTNLMWAAKDNGSKINWANAKSYCENYRGGGYSDWRMPTQDELAGLYDAGKSRPGACNTSYPIHVATELIDITCLAPWASETRGSDAALFDFDGGGRHWRHRSYDNGDRVLPVRSGK